MTTLSLHGENVPHFLTDYVFMAAVRPVLSPFSRKPLLDSDSHTEKLHSTFEECTDNIDVLQDYFCDFEILTHGYPRD
jgi:hypothetical protein